MYFDNIYISIMVNAAIPKWASKDFAGDFVVPEFLQHAATPEALANAVLQWVDAKSTASGEIAALEARFTRLHFDLMRDTSLLATDAIQKILES